MKRILIIRFSSLGDVILTEPIVRVLREHDGNSTIHFLTKPQYAPLLEMFTGVDKVEEWLGDKNFRTTVDSLRNDRYDLVVDLHNNIRSARVRTALGAKSVKAGKDWLKRFSAVHFKKFDTKPRGAIDRYADVLRELKIAILPAAPNLTLTAPARHWGRDERERLGLPENFAIFAAGARYPTKQAPATLWSSIASKLFERDIATILLLGSASESGSLQQIAETIKQTSSETTVHVTTPADITHSAALVESARVTISNDTGPAHLSAALGRPTISLFGPTHPNLGFAPVGKNAEAYTVNEFCSPCSLHGERTCYRDRRHCFLKMDPDDIVNLVEF